MWAKVKAIAIQVHLNSFTVWYGYLVSLSILMQEGFPEVLNDYCPPKVRHTIMVTATIILFIDKTRRALIAVNQGNPPP